MIYKKGKDREALKSLLTLALPMVGSQLLQLTYNFIDMIWVGKLGADSVAAVGSAGFFLNLGWAMASMVTVGVNVKLSQAIGAKKERYAKIVAKSGFLGIAILAVIFSVTMGSSSTFWISTFAMKSEWVNIAASQYLSIGAWGSVITLINLLFISILNSYKQTKKSFKINSIGFILNIVLDPLLIFKFNMGVQGAIIATLISKAITLIFLFREVHKNAYMKVNISQEGGKCLKSIVSLGFPTALQRVIFGLIYIVMGRFIASFGTDAIAIQKIGIQIESITFTLVAGISQASTVIVGQLCGAKKYHEIKQTYRQALLLAACMGVFLTIIFLSIPEMLIRIFVDSPSVVQGGALYLRIIGISQVFMTAEMIGMGTLNGLGRTVIPPVNSILLTSLRIPLAYVMAFSFSYGLMGIWWSISITSVLKGLVLTGMVFYVFNKKITDDETVAN
ncbi:MATE family efflux transporter [Halosquirtibacter laminarini]|uniref:MATE family efflux transporter n=1 Tax=Halosquirtibacter laminarini TaxID=3374600 RepID=A0AC61NJD1_9BACT|nr:MATE family efflux transporter [Prolixibacteraceae bacterium]